VNERRRPYILQDMILAPLFWEKLIKPSVGVPEKHAVTFASVAPGIERIAWHMR
jgi:hypothetical protein